MIEKPVIASAAALFVIGAVLLFIMLRSNLSSGWLYYLLWVAVLGAVLWFACQTCISLAMSGVVYHYEADQKEFTVISPKGQRTIIYYADVVSVDYKPITFLKKERGDKVTITTKYLQHKYNYVFSANKLVRYPDGSPFFIIEERAGLREDMRDFI